MHPPTAKKRNNPFLPRTYGDLKKVTGRVYMVRNITNSSFVVGDDAVAVIDTQVNAPTAARVLGLIRSVTDKPIRYVVNTHYHWDHTNGNALFKKEGAVIFASRLTRDFMIRRQERQKEFLAGRGFQLGSNPLLPDETFEGERVLDVGNCDLRLFFAGAAETDDATAVHVPAEEVVISGDTVMTGSFPIFGQPVWDEGLQGDNQWMDTIHALAALGPKHIIPGHGPLAYQAELDLLVRIQKFFIDGVVERVDQGWPLDRILQDMESKLPAWITGIPVVWGTPRYAILRVWRGLTRHADAGGEPGWQKFKPSAIPQAAGPLAQGRLKGAESLEDFIQMAKEAQEGGDALMQSAILEKAAEIYKDSPDAHSQAAECLIQLSQKIASVLEKGDYFEKAREHWRRALELKDDHVPSILGQGRYLVMMAYRGGDDPKPGMKLLQKAIELGPAPSLQAEAEFYLGIGYRRLAMEPRALAQFKRALELDPAFVPARMALSG